MFVFQIGDIVKTLASNSTMSSGSQQTLSSVLASPSVITKLVFLSLLSLGPVLARERLAALLGSGTPRVERPSSGDSEKPRLRRMRSGSDGEEGEGNGGLGNEMSEQSKERAQKSWRWSRRGSVQSEKEDDERESHDEKAAR